MRKLKVNNFGNYLVLRVILTFILCFLTYNITGKIEYAERAFRTAAKKIKIASSILRLGSEHSDSGKHFSSIVSGHGRNWGIGVVTGCYTKLIVGSNENLGKSDYLIKFKSATITVGCLPLIREMQDESTELRIFNFSNKKNTIKFSYKKKEDTITEGRLVIGKISP